jgi:hypothetical protein
LVNLKTKTMQDQSYLDDYVFHYSSLTDQWSAIPREYYTQYWSNYNMKNIIRSRSFNTLLDIIHKTKGDLNDLNKKLNITNE